MEFFVSLVILPAVLMSAFLVFSMYFCLKNSKDLYYLFKTKSWLLKRKGATACLTILRGLFVTIKSISVALSFVILVGQSISCLKSRRRKMPFRVFKAALCVGALSS